MQDWRPVLNDGLAAFIYHLLLTRMNENPIAKATGFDYKPEFTYDEKDELNYLESLIYKLEKKALSDYYGEDHQTLLVQRWIAHNAEKSGNSDG